MNSSIGLSASFGFVVAERATFAEADRNESRLRHTKAHKSGSHGAGTFLAELLVELIAA